MTKSEFVKAVAETTGTTQKNVKDILAGIEEVVYSAVKNDEEVSIINGLKLSTGIRSARVGRNPSTGEAINIPEKKVPKVRVGAALKACCM